MPHKKTRRGPLSQLSAFVAISISPVFSEETRGNLSTTARNSGKIINNILFRPEWKFELHSRAPSVRAANSACLRPMVNPSSSGITLKLLEPPQTPRSVRPRALPQVLRAIRRVVKKLQPRSSQGHQIKFAGFPEPVVLHYLIPLRTSDASSAVVGPIRIAWCCVSQRPTPTGCGLTFLTDLRFIFVITVIVNFFLQLHPCSLIVP